MRRRNRHFRTQTRVEAKRVNTEDSQNGNTLKTQRNPSTFGSTSSITTQIISSVRHSPRNLMPIDYMLTKVLLPMGSNYSNFELEAGLDDNTKNCDSSFYLTSHGFRTLTMDKHYPIKNYCYESKKDLSTRKIRTKLRKFSKKNPRKNLLNIFSSKKINRRKLGTFERSIKDVVSKLICSVDEEETRENTENDSCNIRHIEDITLRKKSIRKTRQSKRNNVVNPTSKLELKKTNFRDSQKEIPKCVELLKTDTVIRIDPGFISNVRQKGCKKSLDMSSTKRNTLQTVPNKVDQQRSNQVHRSSNKTKNSLKNVNLLDTAGDGNNERCDLQQELLNTDTTSQYNTRQKNRTRQMDVSDYEKRLVRSSSVITRSRYTEKSNILDEINSNPDTHKKKIISEKSNITVDPVRVDSSVGTNGMKTSTPKIKSIRVLRENPRKKSCLCAKTQEMRKSECSVLESSILNTSDSGDSGFNEDFKADSSAEVLVKGNSVEILSEKESLNDTSKSRIKLKRKRTDMNKISIDDNERRKLPYRKCKVFNRSEAVQILPFNQQNSTDIYNKQPTVVISYMSQSVSKNSHFVQDDSKNDIDSNVTPKLKNSSSTVSSCNNSFNKTSTSVHTQCVVEHAKDSTIGCFAFPITQKGFKTCSTQTLSIIPSESQPERISRYVQTSPLSNLQTYASCYTEEHFENGYNFDETDTLKGKRRTIKASNCPECLYENSKAGKLYWRRLKSEKEKLYKFIRTQPELSKYFILPQNNVYNKTSEDTLGNSTLDMPSLTEDDNEINVYTISVIINENNEIEIVHNNPIRHKENKKYYWYTKHIKTGTPVLFKSEHEFTDEEKIKKIKEWEENEKLKSIKTNIRIKKKKTEKSKVKLKNRHERRQSDQRVPTMITQNVPSNKVVCTSYKQEKLPIQTPKFNIIQNTTKSFLKKRNRTQNRCIQKSSVSTNTDLESSISLKSPQDPTTAALSDFDFDTIDLDKLLERGEFEQGLKNISDSIEGTHYSTAPPLHRGHLNYDRDENGNIGYCAELIMGPGQVEPCFLTYWPHRD